ncbi:MAG: rhodanese-like domain-containing protein [Photobacterium halotolerans]
MLVISRVAYLFLCSSITILCKGLAMRFFVCLFGLLAFQSQANWFSAEYAHGVTQEKVEVLAKAQREGAVLFIDTREPDEYAESHIPGAINIPLREINELNVSDMEGYGYVVPYCLKDFRGFETAKALQNKGLKNVVLMEPAGLNGWRSAGLPTEQ